MSTFAELAAHPALSPAPGLRLFLGSAEPDTRPLPPPTRRTPNGRIVPRRVRGLHIESYTLHGGLVLTAADSKGDIGNRWTILAPDATAAQQDAEEARLLAQLEQDDPIRPQLVPDDR